MSGKSEFNIGDTVILTVNANGRMIEEVGTIIEVDNEGAIVSCSVKFEYADYYGYYKAWFFDNQLQLLKRPYKSFEDMIK